MQRARQGIASQRSKTDVFFLRDLARLKWKSGVIDHDCHSSSFDHSARS